MKRTVRAEIILDRKGEVTFCDLLEDFLPLWRELTNQKNEREVKIYDKYGTDKEENGGTTEKVSPGRNKRVPGRV